MAFLCTSDYRKDFPYHILLFFRLTNSGSGIFHSSNPAAYARAIVEATTHYKDAAKLAEVCTGLGAGMAGENDLSRPGLTSE